MKSRYHGEIDEIEYGAHTIKIEWHQEEWCVTPWNHDEGYGIVTDWERRDKRPREMILFEDRGSKRFYDFAESVAMFRKDWEITGQQAHDAALERFKRLQAWCNNSWCYCWAKVTIPGTDYCESLGMIESDYAADEINDLTCEAKAFIDAEYRKMVVDYRLLTLA